MYISYAVPGTGAQYKERKMTNNVHILVMPAGTRNSNLAKYIYYFVFIDVYPLNIGEKNKIVII